MNEILILGGNHQNPLGVMEALGQKGLKSNVIIYGSCKSSFVLKSRYVKKSWICATTTEILTCILANFKDPDNKAVAFACNDDMASFLSDNYDKLAPFLFIPGIKEQGALTAWTNKGKMCEEAAAIGLTIPKTWIVENKQIPADIIYPCVTKSLTSVNNGKSEFILCNKREELESFLSEHVHSNKIQVQQFIDKEFEFQYIGCSLNEGEVVIIPGRTHIEVTTHFNNLTFLKYQKDKIVNDPATLTLTEKFVRYTGYSGLFSVEFMHGKDGKDYFLEMNFRNEGNGIVVTAAGTNLPYIWYLYCTGGDYQKEIASSSVIDTYCAPEDSYFISMLQGDLTFKDWRQNMKKCTCYITYFKDDTRPFWALMWLMKRSIVASLVIYFLRKLHLR